MRLVILSDTHNQHAKIELPKGDVLVHTGDFSGVGSKHEVLAFLDWLETRDHPHKVFIAGNHDRSFDPKFTGGKHKPDWLRERLAQLPPQVRYLENSATSIDGVTFWGSPYSPWFFGEHWAFNLHRGEEIRCVWETIPQRCDVVLTHGPVYGILDYIPSQEAHVGCEELAKKLQELSIRLHCSGHIHEAYGTFKDPTGKLYVNSSILDEHYRISHEPIVVDL